MESVLVSAATCDGIGIYKVCYTSTTAVVCALLTMK